MLPEVRKILRRRYDPDLVYHLYQSKSYQLDTMLELMMPLIYIVLMSEFYELDDTVEDEIVSAAIEDLLVSLHGHSCHHTEFSRFNTYYYKLIWRAMIECLSSMRRAQEGELIYRVRLTHPHDVESRVYLEQLNNEILDRVLDQIRFRDNKWLACQYIATRILTDRKIIRRVLRVDLGVEDPEFLCTYTNVLIRKVIYEIREDPKTYKFLAQRYELYGYDGLAVLEDAE